MTQHLVLLGAGLAHLAVLRHLAKAPLSGGSGVNGISITLVSPHPQHLYAGMLPGWVAGHYALADCVIELPPLAARAHVVFRSCAAAGLDLAAQSIRLSDGQSLKYDWLSIDIGGRCTDLLGAYSPAPKGGAQQTVSRDQIVRSSLVLPVGPIEGFVAGWQSALSRWAGDKPEHSRRIAVVGGGMSGVELALATKFRLPTATVVLVADGVDILLDQSDAVRAALSLQLKSAGVAVMRQSAAKRLEGDTLILANGHSLKLDLALVATGATPHAWPIEAGLAAEADGAIAVNEYLQSTSHPNIFAAGDCASVVRESRPKSGVYAWRAGKALAENLRRKVLAQPLKRYCPQVRTLYLVSCGRRFAVGSWGSRAVRGRWVWAWKDKTDRRFIESHK